MRLVTFSNGDEVRSGLLEGDRLLDVVAAAEALGTSPRHLGSVQSIIDGGDEARDDLDELVAAADGAAGEPYRVDAAAVELLPPLPRPPKFICVARNYGAHAAEAKKELLDYPNLFVRFSQTLVGDRAEVMRPFVSDELDWEGELAFVIGRGGRHIAEEDAYDHIFGYSIFNDVTVRDYQFRVPQFVGGKNFDTSGPFGPSLVTADEVPDPLALDLEVRVNNDVVQSANTGEMLFKIPFLVAHISEFVSLEPGDVIATGTPAGVGFVRKPPRFLVPGDVMTVSITGLGELKNPVVQEPV